MTRKTRSRPCHQGQNLIASAFMKLRLISAGIACCASSIALPAVAEATPQTLPYVENGHARHVLDHAVQPPITSGFGPLHGPISHYTVHVGVGDNLLCGERRPGVPLVAPARPRTVLDQANGAAEMSADSLEPKEVFTKQPAQLVPAKPTDGQPQWPSNVRQVANGLA